ncbi:MAG: tRNA (N6-threonylcarbamoyladenosine(37)-N6)-methyltransferase TrmO [Clostridia bacterium]|nr:tRNA (N6-threonylcarbamoyladenosine(37)-N6)-methyltransferase TrmO [Clostridia bacterium]
MEIMPIAHIRNDFVTKFGVPRQSGLAPSLISQVVFQPAYRIADALRGLEDFSHLWLIWEFSEAKQAAWSPTVRPPRLGGNQRMGVFATRSPFRPNSLGLSCVKIEKICLSTPEGPVIWVSGADLMNGTPIYDMKPYLPYADCRMDAVGGFTDAVERAALTVVCPEALMARIPSDRRQAVQEILAQDPRPSYQHDPERVYGMAFGSVDIRFRVNGSVLTVTDVIPAGGSSPK